MTWPSARYARTEHADFWLAPSNVRSRRTDKEGADLTMPTVLIVEDDPDIRTLERHALEGGGYDVAVATNGREGLQRLRGGAVPCLILLDLMMPVMDGLAFLAERRKTHIGEDIPVVCVTAGGPELMARARELGAIACVDKPTDFEDLCEVVRQYCGR